MVRRPDRGRARQAAGWSRLSIPAHRLRGCLDFLVKLDGDLCFEPDYFARCLEHFEGDPALGIGGGLVCCARRRAELRSTGRRSAFHVRGATKIYRRACWERIAPLPRAPGWDTIDEVWPTGTDGARALSTTCACCSSSPTGSVDGSWANALKNGRANYMTGYHPVFMLAKCGNRLRRAPSARGRGVVGRLLSGYWSGSPAWPTMATCATCATSSCAAC